VIVELKSQCRPSQSRKESGSRNIGPLGRGSNIGRNIRAGVRTAAACLGELTTERGKGS